MEQSLDCTEPRPYVEAGGQRSMVLRLARSGFDVAPALPIGPLRVRLHVPGGTSIELAAESQLAPAGSTLHIVGDATEYAALAGQYLLEHQPCTPASLRAAGLPPRSVERALELRIQQTAAERAAVMGLRQRAYAAVGKVPRDLDPARMEDPFDRDARILMAIHRGTVVGTARLVLPGPHDATEYDAYATLPASIDRGSLAVLSRIATDEAYRGGNLLYALVLRSLIIARDANRAIVIGGVSDPLLPVYARVGARGTGVYFSHGALSGNPEQLVYFDVASVIRGDSVRADLWRDIVARPRHVEEEQLLGAMKRV